jgi:uncharacterized protein YoxC
LEALAIPNQSRVAVYYGKEWGIADLRGTRRAVVVVRWGGRRHDVATTPSARENPSNPFLNSAARTMDGPMRTANVAAHAVGGFARGVNGLARGVNGLAHAVNGLAYAVDGLARAVNGLAHAVNGLAHAVNGLVHAVNGLARAVNGLARAMNGLARVVNGLARAVNGPARAVNGLARMANGVTSVVIRSDHAVICSVLAVIRPHDTERSAGDGFKRGMSKSSKERHPKAVFDADWRVHRSPARASHGQDHESVLCEVVDCPAFSPFMQELRVGYMENLNEERAGPRARDRGA